MITWQSNCPIRLVHSALQKVLLCLVAVFCGCRSVPADAFFGSVINSSADEIAACRAGDALVFLRVGQDRTETLLTTRQCTDGSWTTPTKLDFEPLHRWRAGKPAIASLGDGRLLTVFPANRTASNVDLAEAFFDGIRWSTPVWLDLLNSSSWDSQPTLSADGTLLVFCSDREGNRNLYLSVRTAQGWSAPRPLSINTADDEITPALLPDSSLLFARRTENRSYDLYRAVQSAPLEWTSAERLPPPINSNADDLAPVVWDSLVIISSNRNGSFDLFSFMLCGPVTLRIQVYPSASVQLLDGVLTVASKTAITTVPIEADGSAIVPLKATEYTIVRYTNQCSGFSCQWQFSVPCDMQQHVVLELPIQLPDSSIIWQETFSAAFAPEDYLPATVEHHTALQLLARYNLDRATRTKSTAELDSTMISAVAGSLVSVFRCAPSAHVEVTIAASLPSRPILYTGAPLDLAQSGYRRTILPGSMLTPADAALLRGIALEHYLRTTLSQHAELRPFLRQVHWRTLSSASDNDKVTITLSITSP
ncbi:MAG: hypothetical protein RML15_07185 [Bacteroidota bacterium]|nr:hypothetical protein [Candidatus Kapabacteria bacterium]MCS7303073.1 hypothetical protein [Candidatus Kapabacteria bacterium]MDW8075390.1 hypothetical protein [Bacteroidota bacterium]MDW8272175.1 hypothetical protein [Bacteroidota bacterium]